MSYLETPPTKGGLPKSTEIQLLPGSLPLYPEEVAANALQTNLLAEDDEQPAITGEFHDGQKTAATERLLAITQEKGLLNNLVQTVTVGYSEGNSQFLVNRRPNATYMNELAPVFGLEPGKDTFRFVQCTEGGEIPSPHYVKHLGQREAPLATKGYKGVYHDRALNDHLLGWWLLPKETIDDLAAVSNQAYADWQQNPGPEAKSERNDERLRIDSIGKAVDWVTSIAFNGYTDALNLLDPDQDLSIRQKLIIQKPRLEGISLLVDQLYYHDVPYMGLESGGEDNRPETNALRKAIFSRALDLAHLAEQTRPEIDASAAKRLAKTGLYHFSKLRARF